MVGLFFLVIVFGVVAMRALGTKSEMDALAGGTATLAAIRTELSPSQGQGRIEVLAGGVKVELALHQGQWLVTAQGRPLGSIEPASGRIDDPGRGLIGAYQRGPAESALQLRGVMLASIDRGATIDAHPAQLRPLLRLPAPLQDGEASLWLLAVVGPDLGLAPTPVHGRGSSSGVP